jgi:formamidopyrimidine-DNA glycosylase
MKTEKNDGTRLQRKAEAELLNQISIKCKECNKRMRTGLQEGRRYYYCGNNKDHKNNQDRMVYVR